MDRRKFLSASVTLLTVGVVGCSQSSGDAAPTDDSTSTASPTQTASGTQLRYEGDTLTLDTAPDQEIRGTTDIAPGTTLVLSVRSETASNPFLHRPETTVQDDGGFSTTVDLSGADDGTEFTVSVLRDGETLTEADGRVT